MSDTVLKFIMCFCSSIAAACIAALLVEDPHRSTAALAAYALTAGAMYWLLGLDDTDSKGDAS